MSLMISKANPDDNFSSCGFNDDQLKHFESGSGQPFESLLKEEFSKFGPCLVKK
jgi:hypothetical protein